MKILVLGAHGMIGKTIWHALRDAGHEVTGAGRGSDRTGATWISLEFADMRDKSAWLPLLDGFEAVVNCVGLITERHAGEFDLVHRDAPAALFAACGERGMAVIQLSALGSDSGSPAAYWRSKGQADALLAAQGGRYAILQPSLVFSPEGASSRMFLALASLPLVLLPAGKQVPVQPVHAHDVAAAVVGLLRADPSSGLWGRRVAVVGARRLSLAAYLSELGQGMQARRACCIEMPLNCVAAIARITASLRLPLLAPEPIAMLAASVDGRLCSPTTDMERLLGRMPRDPREFASPAMRAAAVTSWAYPLLTLVIALMWLATAWVSWFAWPHAQSHAWLQACGLPAQLQEAALATASAADLAIGAALLGPRRWHGVLWPLQIALVLAYSLVMTFCLPDFWLHPFGPLLKNVPLLALFCAMWRLR